MCDGAGRAGGPGGDPKAGLKRFVGLRQQWRGDGGEAAKAKAKAKGPER
jgi:hypothetical protein